MSKSWLALGAGALPEFIARPEMAASSDGRYGLQKDISAVAAAVDTQWSTGQVEGQINRLKTIKRQMYGSAGFQLLRARVLPYVPAGAAPSGPAP